MIRKLLWLVLLLAPPAFSQSTGTLQQGQLGRSCNAVTAPTTAAPGAVGGCTAFALLTSGGTLPNTYTFEVTGGTASFQGSLDGTAWTALGTGTNTSQTFGGAYRWLGCVPTSVSGSLTCNISVTVGSGGGGGGGGSTVHVNGTVTTLPNFNNTTPPPPANSAPVSFQVSGDNVSAALEGDGNGDDCFHGDGMFKPCGVTSIDSLTGAFNFTGAVTCTAGTPNVCNFTGGGAGGVGTGVVGQYAIYDTTSTVAGSPVLVLAPQNHPSTDAVIFNSLIPGSPISAIANQGIIATTSAGILQGFNSNDTGGAFTIRGTNVNSTIVSGGTPLNFNSTTPVAPANGLNIAWQVSGTSISAALVGDGIATDCFLGNGTFGPCPGGGGGSGTVGAGTAGQFALYNGTNSIAGSPALTFGASPVTGTVTDTISATAPIVLPSTPNQGIVCTGATAPLNVSLNTSPGMFGCLAAGNPGIQYTGSGGALRYITTTTINGVNVTTNSVQWSGTNANPPVCAVATPTNGRCLTIQNSGGAGGGTFSYFLVGDGTTNCLSGQGTYVPCGAGGSGTVGNGVTGQFAFYTGTNTVQGTANLTNNISNLATIVPFEFITPSVLPPPVAGANLLTVDPTGALVFSQNGGAFAPVGGGGGIGGSGTTGQIPRFTAATTLGNSALSDSGTIITATEPLALSGTSPNFQFPNFPATAPTPVSGIPQLAVYGAGGAGGAGLWFSLGSTTGGSNTFQRVATTPTVNSTLMNTQAVIFSGTAPNTCSATNFPANGRCIVFYTPGPNTGQISAALVGDGTTNCLSGQGTYVGCGTGGGGSGTVGAGTAGQFALYNGTTSVAGTPDLTDDGSSIVANIPLAASTITSFDVASGPGLAPPTLPAANGGFAVAAGGIPQINYNGAGWVRLNSVTTVGSSAMNTAGLTLANTGNPATPTNGYRLTFASTQQNVTNTMIGAFIVGDGVATDCLIGTGTFSPCPGGTGGGVGGSGTAGTVPVFTGATALGNSLITASPQIIFFGTAANPLIPNNAATSNAGLVANVKEQVPTCVPSGSTAGPGFAPIGVGDVGCLGSFVNFSGDSPTSNGVSAGFMVASNSSSNNATGTLGLGIASLLSPGAGTTELRAGYFQSESTGGTSTNNRGLFAAAFNTGSGVSALPLNEAIVAQTGNLGAAGLSAGPTTADYTVHCLAPNNVGSQVLMTNHACVKIESQGTGVELQTGAHVFANLPGCSTAYEGSIAAITDASATSGTVTGGGSNHVLIYCNGSNWTAAAGGGGGGAASDLTCTTNTNTLWSNSSGNATICTFNLAANHNYIIRCVYSIAFATQSTSAVSDVDVGIHVVNGPANVSYFRGTFTDPSKTFADQSSVSGVTGTAGNGGVPNDFNLMRAANIGSSPPNTTNNEEGFGFTIDGVYPTSAAGDTLIFYVGSSLAGSGGNVLPGAYCRLE